MHKDSAMSNKISLASHCVREFSSPSDELMSGEGIKSQLAAMQEGDFVVDKKNYLSFVAAFWPPSSLA